MKGICLECNIEFEFPNWKGTPIRKFCSLTCAHKYNKRHNKNGGNTSSLDAFIKIYGEEEGKLRHLTKSKKISESNMGRISPMLGKHFSDEQKIKMSDVVKNSTYHINLKGKPLSEEKKSKISKKLKGTFTLNWFIQKYGESIGNIKYQERCNKISANNGFKKYNLTNKNNYSKTSQKLFWTLYNDLNLKNRKIYFGELNHEYGCGTNTNFDFVDVDNKKIIEFNGDIWHGNPKLFKENDTPNPYNKTLTVKEIWNSDNHKIEKAKAKGYDVLIIWHSDYKQHKQEVIEKCKNFLMNT